MCFCRGKIRSQGYLQGEKDFRVYKVGFEGMDLKG